MMNSFLNHDNLLDVNDNICMYMLSKFPQSYTLVDRVTELYDKKNQESMIMMIVKKNSIYTYTTYQ